MIEEIKKEWERDETSRCPYCGSMDFDWDESDDGIDDGVHWFVWRCSCGKCNEGWSIEYDLVNPRVYGSEW